MEYIVNWKSLNRIEDGCGGVIYKILDVENSGLKNVEVAMCIFAPGETARLHFHKEMEEIYFIIDGEGLIELDGAWQRIKAEDCISIPIGVKHRIKNTDADKNLKFLSINSPKWRVSDMVELSG